MSNTKNITKELERRLKLFHKQAEKLKKYPEFFVNQQVQIKASGESGVGKVRYKGTDGKTLSAVFMVFRPFVMEGSIPYEKICEDIIKENSDKDIINKTHQALDKWKAIRKSKSVMTLKTERGEITPWANLQHWMNEEYFHPEKYKIGGNRGLAAVQRHPIFESLSKMECISLLQWLCPLVMAVDKQIIIPLLGLDEQNGYKK